MINKLKKKFVIINISLISIILTCIFVGVYIYTSQNLIKDSNGILERILDEKHNEDSFKKEIGKPKDKDGHRPFPAATFSVQLDKNNNIIDLNSNNVEIYNMDVFKKVIKECVASKEDSGIIKNENFRYLKKENINGLKIAFVDRTNEVNTLTSLIKTSIFVGFAGFVAFFIISIFLANWAVKPIEKSWNQQKKFVADASHELKTPITVILTNTDIVLSNTEATVNQQIKWINYIKMEAERMKELVNNLLFLAKVDSNSEEIVFSSVNISDTLWECILPLESVAFEENKIIESDIESDLFINGELSKLKQLIIIFLDNAIKYSNDNSTIKVALSKNQEKIRFSVNNIGDIISEEDIEYIFERFYCLDKSRSRETGGYGLGLSIAQSIVNLHKGKIYVKSNKNEGNTFTVDFPVNIKK